MDDVELNIPNYGEWGQKALGKNYKGSSFCTGLIIAARMWETQLWDTNLIKCVNPS